MLSVARTGMKVTEESSGRIPTRAISLFTRMMEVFVVHCGSKYQYRYWKFKENYKYGHGEIIALLHFQTLIF